MFLVNFSTCKTSSVRIHNPEVSGSTPDLATRSKAPYIGAFLFLGLSFSVGIKVLGTTYVQLVMVYMVYFSL